VAGGEERRNTEKRREAAARLWQAHTPAARQDAARINKNAAAAVFSAGEDAKKDRGRRYMQAIEPRSWREDNVSSTMPRADSRARESTAFCRLLAKCARRYVTHSERCATHIARFA